MVSKYVSHSKLMYHITNHVPNNVSNRKPCANHLSANKPCIIQCIDQLTMYQIIYHLTKHVSTNPSYLQYFTSCLSINDNLIVTAN